MDLLYPASYLLHLRCLLQHNSDQQGKLCSQKLPSFPWWDCKSQLDSEWPFSSPEDNIHRLDKEHQWYHQLVQR